MKKNHYLAFLVVLAACGDESIAPKATVELKTVAAGGSYNNEGETVPKPVFQVGDTPSEPFADGSAPAQGFVDFRIRRAVEQMQDNPDQQYDLDALARSVGLSRSRFNVLFKDTVGVGPGIYGNAIRIEAAVSALADRASAQDVAADLGFSSPGNFNRFFRYHTGVSPAKFKRALQDIG